MSRVRALPWITKFAVLGVLWFVAYFATQQLELPQADRTDEPEWTAISIVHYRQLGGEAPPGVSIDLERGALHEDPWRQGVQATTFGWPNPGSHKWLWGLVCNSSAPESLEPWIFFRYHRGNLQRAGAAIQPLEDAIERARWLVAVASATCALFLFCIAKRVSGVIGGAMAMSLWLFHPLVREWSHQARPDFGMVALLLGTLCGLVSGARVIRGDHGRLARYAALIGLGVVAGLCAAAKLNGALAAIFLVLGLPFVHAGTEGGFPWRKLGLSWLVCGVVVLLTLWANFPYLWSAPSEHLSDVLAFWKKHMAFQQDRFESSGGRVARTLGEQASLMYDRLVTVNEPLGAVTGLGASLLWILAALADVCLLTFKGRAPSAARCLLVASLVTVIGTTLWLPLDWARYYFAPLALIVLLEACSIGALVEWAWRRFRSKKSSEEAAPTAG